MSRFLTPILTLAMTLGASTASALTATAIFSGTIDEANGIGASMTGIGETMQVTLIGQTDAPGTESDNLLLAGVSFGPAVTYDLDSLEIAIPSLGIMETSTMATITVARDQANDVIGAYDYVVAEGRYSGGIMRYVVGFDVGTFDLNELTIAIEQGILGSSPDIQFATLAPNAAGEGPFDGWFTPVSLDDLTLTETPTDPEDPVDPPVDPVTPVPVPAGLPLLVLGVGALSLMRKRA